MAAGRSFKKDCEQRSGLLEWCESCETCADHAEGAAETKCMWECTNTRTNTQAQFRLNWLCTLVVTQQYSKKSDRPSDYMIVGERWPSVSIVGKEHDEHHDEDQNHGRELHKVAHKWLSVCCNWNG